MLYYPVKALWTAMVVVIPMASAGLVTMVTLLWRSGGSLDTTGSGWSCEG